MAREPVSAPPARTPEARSQELEDWLGAPGRQRLGHERDVLSELKDLRERVGWLQEVVERWEALFSEFDSKYISVHERMDEIDGQEIGATLREQREAQDEEA